MTEPRVDTLRDLEHEVGVLIRRVRRVIGERARMVHPDLQPASYLILTTVAQEEPLRASAISELFDVDKGAISRQVKHLVDLGLLQHEKDPADARASLLSVTDEARTRMADVVAHRQKELGEKLAGWTDEDLSSFVGELSRYNRALNLVEQ
ncbi:MarR family winged helix-turn-helix transcriptional regulator [Nocardioides sp.]|uniref:MarR family winged helix-turn-helix transcriptional regulator n=1 Tax=Nocardioides sp. TaxID=35761 RepID=UPI00271CE3BD|nr:MarR family transcriptional regulator [Nocardioides sp.]MDO9455921.1 MarR family transcriptional regulator [Nocardioides sp.]